MVFASSFHEPTDICRLRSVYCQGEDSFLQASSVSIVQPMSTVAMNTLLCDILRFGFFGGDNPVERRSVDEGMWQRLFEESRKEAVTALVYDAML